MTWLLQFLAKALNPREREFVLGHLAEGDRFGWSAVWDIAGLVARRQLQIWSNWRPWVALIGVAGLSGCFLGIMLAGMSLSVWEQWNSWSKYGVHYNTGVTSFGDEVLHLSILGGAIICWSAMNASMLKRLSGPAAWLTGTFFYLATLDSGAAYRWLSSTTAFMGPPRWWRWLMPMGVIPTVLVIALFVVPAVIASRRRVPALVPLTLLLTMAAAWIGDIRAHDLEIYSGGAFPAASWLNVLAPYILVSWPLALRLRLR